MTSVVNELINKHNMENRIILKEYDALTLILYIDSMNHIIEEIQDTVLRTKIMLPNNKLLTLKEITLVESLLVEQGINVRFPEEALEYATPKVAIREDCLLYILQIPKLYDQNAEVIEIIPLTTNNYIIPEAPKYVIKMQNSWFLTHYPEKTIQKESDLSTMNDDCIHAILKGAVSHCKTIENHDITIKQVSRNKILINNSKQSYIGSNCGPHNRSLTGNYLITFHNCTVVINNKVYAPEEVIDNITYDFQGAFPNLKINWSFTEHYNISTLKNSTEFNREHMELMKLEQSQHKSWIITLAGGLSTTTLTIIGIFLYVCLRRRKLIIKIKNPGRINQKLEDDLSLPPRGVTVDTPPVPAANPIAQHATGCIVSTLRT